MEFRLLDKDGKTKVHDGVMARIKPAQSVTWGDRAFVRTDIKDDVAVYREVDNFRIGR